MINVHVTYLTDLAYSVGYVAVWWSALPGGWTSRAENMLAKLCSGY